MTYHFIPGEDLATGLGRIAAWQLARLDRLLGDDKELASGHHRTRKCVKRLRALLMLARTNLGQGCWRRLDRRLAAVGQSLSGERDQAVMLDRLAKLAADLPAGVQEDSAADIGRLLQKRHYGANGSNGTGGPAASDRARLQTDVARIGKAIGRVLRMVTHHSMIAGMAVTYRTGREAFKTAYRLDTAEAFHDLRKQVQRHGRHMQLMLLIWPEALGARVELARRLSDLLGEDHDLALLRKALRPLKGKAAAAALDRLCKERQRVIRAIARPLLQRFYAERSRALAKRIGIYWIAALASEDGHERPQLGSPLQRQ